MVDGVLFPDFFSLLQLDSLLPLLDFCVSTLYSLTLFSLPLIFLSLLHLDSLLPPLPRFFFLFSEHRNTTFTCFPLVSHLFPMLM